MKNVTYLLFLIMGLCTCQSKHEIVQNMKGTYAGVFTVEYNNGHTRRGAVEVIFSEMNTYKSSGNGNLNDFYPAGGNGTYEVEDSKLIFLDTNIWLAHFDHNLVLSGKYEYVIDGNQLTLTASKNGVGLYTYELFKQD